MRTNLEQRIKRLNDTRPRIPGAPSKLYAHPDEVDKLRASGLVFVGYVEVEGGFVAEFEGAKCG